MRPRCGTIERHGDHWDARLTLSDGSRPRVCLDVVRAPDEQTARDLARQLSERATQLGAVSAVATDDVTFEQWVPLWLGERERRKHSSVRNDESRYRAHVAPLFAKVSVRSVDKIAVERFVERLDARIAAQTLSWKTALNVWTLFRKMLSDAASSKTLALRVRDDDPTVGVRGPDRGASKSKQYLYPAEVVRLLACESVAIERRELYAIAIYTGARAGELEALRWSEVDLDRANITINASIDGDTRQRTTPKSQRSRRFAIEPELLPLLRSMASRGDALVLSSLLPSWRHNAAEQLRDDLRLAGVDRATLFEQNETQKQLSFHDLRATHLTWCAIRGDSTFKIRAKAGHQQSQTTDAYVRDAEVVRESFGEPFPPLPRSLVPRDAVPALPERASTVVLVEPVEAPTPASEPQAGNRPAIVRGEKQNPQKPFRFPGVLPVRGGGLECQGGNTSVHEVAEKMRNRVTGLRHDVPRRGVSSRVTSRA